MPSSVSTTYQLTNSEPRRCTPGATSAMSAKLTREVDGEPRASEGRIADLDLRVVVARLLRDERQAEPAARAVGPVDARERGEDPLALAGRDAGAVVVDVEDGAARAFGRHERDLDAPSLAPVARRVGDEVGDEHPQPRLPALDHHGLVGQLGVEVQRRVLRRRAADHLVDEVA